MYNRIKIMAVAILSVLSIPIFSGCAPSYVDGSYRAEMSDFDSLGYKEYVTAVVDGGRVAAINIGSEDRNGVTKTNNSEYRIAMELATGTYPDEVYSTLDARYLVFAQNSDEESSVEAVAGATLTSNNYAMLYEALKDSFITGETLVIVDSPIED